MTTKTISTTAFRDNLAEALEAVNGNDILVISRRGKAEKAVIDLDKLEDLLAASNPKYLASIKEARAEAKRGELFSMEDVFGDI